MVFNRDVNLNKKTKPLNVFEEDKNIIGGRDIEGKGTWLGINITTNILAVLTNYDTENSIKVQEQKYGRGQIVLSFLRTENLIKRDEQIIESMNKILKEKNKFNGFNLLVFNFNSGNCFYICNHYDGDQPKILRESIYSLSNSDLFTVWPKTKYGEQLFKDIITNENYNENQLEQGLLNLAQNNQQFTQNQEDESSLFIDPYFSTEYQSERGTLSTTILFAKNNTEQNNGTLQKFVRKQYKNFKNEEIGFSAALLTQTRNKINQIIFNGEKYDVNQIMQEIYPQLNLMETYEHWQIANNDHIEQIFNQFDALKKAAGNQNLVFNKRYEELSNLTALIDPDKFPIFSLIEVIDTQDIVSIWDYKPEYLEKARQNLGFSLKVDKSKLEHHEAGDGVYIQIDTDSEFSEIGKVPIGTLVGLVPGIVFDSIKDLDNYHGNNIRENDEYLHRADDTVIDFSSKIYYPNDLANNMTDLKNIIDSRQENNPNDNNNIYSVYGEMINPYAVGHKINHPPKDQSPNVIYQDIYIPIHFFSQQYLQFYPNIRAGKFPENLIKKGKDEINFIDNKTDYLRAVGVFALRDLKDGEELYANYFELNMFDVEEERDWLKRPPPLSPYFTKVEYQNEFSLLARIIDSFLFKKYASLYEQFEQRVQHDPNRHEFETYKQEKLQNQQKNSNLQSKNQKVQQGNFFNNKLNQFQKKQKGDEQRK